MRALSLQLVILLVASPAAAQAPRTARPQQAEPPAADPPHLETPDDPALLPATVGSAQSSVAGVSGVRFGVLRSVQVNVNALGANILGDAANEPSIALDPTDPNHMAIGWRQFDTVASNFRQAGWAYTADAGRTWTFPGVLDPGVFRSDPVLGFDAQGVFYYNSLASTFLCSIFKSADGGQTWGPPLPAFGGDKQWMAIDRTLGIGNGNIYCAWSVFAGCCGNNTFTRSTNGGASFSTPIAIPNTPIFGTQDVGGDGDLYIAGADPSDFTRFYVAKSSTVQNPFTTPAFDFATQVDLGGALGLSMAGPNPGGLLGQVDVAVDPTCPDDVYVLCSVDPPGPDPLDVSFARSTDGGVTWSAPIRVNDDPAGTNAWQWFAAMSVAPNGRIDVVWNDTRDSGAQNISRLTYSFSVNGGATWAPNVPVSPFWDSHVGWPNQNKIGDYYDLVSNVAGVHVAYAATFNGEQDVYYLRIPTSR